MVVVTVADTEVLERLPADEPEVRFVRWEVAGSLPSGVAEDAVDAVVLPASRVGQRELERLHDLPGLRLVQLASAGYEHVRGRSPRRADLANARGVHDAGTAELAVGLLLASQRGIDVAARDMPDGRWAPVRRRSLADRRVMVLGYGSIGAAVARRLAPFEVELVRVASRARRDGPDVVHGVEELPRLLPTVDAVVCTLPLTDGTRGLLGRDALAALPDDAVVVNVGRGAVVDTVALLAEAAAGRLRAALDVVDPEPLPANHPAWRTPGVLVVPHVGGLTDATAPRLADLVLRQARALRDGDAPHNVVVGAER